MSGSIIDIGVLNNTSPSFKIFSHRAQCSHVVSIIIVQ